MPRAAPVTKTIYGATSHAPVTANERTFHAWLRFSMSLSSTGVVIAHMSQIQCTVHPNREREWKYYILGVPQGCICQGVAIIFVAIGAVRFFKQEQVMMRGRVRTNGWELWLAVGFLFVVGPLLPHDMPLSLLPQVLGLFFWLVFLADGVKAFDEL